MSPKMKEITEMDRLIDTLRAIVGALNTMNSNNDSSIPVAIARIETRMENYEKSLSNTQKMLIGLAAGLFTLVAKMIVERVFK